MTEYSERIFVRKTWIMTMVATSILISLLIVGTVLLGTSEASEAKSGILVLIVTEVALLTFVLISHLSFRLTKAGIYYRWYPLQRSERFIQWEEVSKAHVRKYNALSEYGGWGIKGRKKNRAFNVSGSMGLQLELLSGNKVLIETQKPEELKSVLAALKAAGLQNKIE